MAEQKGFLRAIIDAPDEDTHRLIYADWLEEHGEEARAEFIRVQCARALLPAAEYVEYLNKQYFDFPGIWQKHDAKEVEEAKRIIEQYRQAAPELAILEAREKQLLTEHRKRFVAPFVALGIRTDYDSLQEYHEEYFYLVFRRGFVEEMTIDGEASAARFVKVADPLCRLCPLRHIDFDSSVLDVTNFDPGQFLDRPIRLRTLEAIVALPQLERLKSLVMTWHRFGDAGAQILLASPYLTAETTLVLGNNDFSPEAQERLRARFGSRVLL